MSAESKAKQANIDIDNVSVFLNLSTVGLYYF